jgi:hypothetical protein
MCVKGLQCGSPFGLRKRDPPIIKVEFPQRVPNMKEVKSRDGCSFVRIQTKIYFLSRDKLHFCLLAFSQDMI